MPAETADLRPLTLAELAGSAAVRKYRASMRRWHCAALNCGGPTHPRSEIQVPLLVLTAPQLRRRFFSVRDRHFRKVREHARGLNRAARAGVTLTRLLNEIQIYDSTSRLFLNGRG